MIPTMKTILSIYPAVWLQVNNRKQLSDADSWYVTFANQLVDVLQMSELFNGKTIYYAWTDEERKEILEKSKVKLETQRYKGLGEMNADQLWETTMNPETRSLVKININDVALAEKRVSILMGDKVEPRKEWIEENVDFTLQDDYRK